MNVLQVVTGVSAGRSVHSALPVPLAGDHMLFAGRPWQLRSIHKHQLENRVSPRGKATTKVLGRGERHPSASVGACSTPIHRRGRPRREESYRVNRERIRRVLAASQNIQERLKKLAYADARSVAITLSMLYDQMSPDDHSRRTRAETGSVSSAAFVNSIFLSQPTTHLTKVLAARRWIQRKTPNTSAGFLAREITPALMTEQKLALDLSTRLAECRS